MSVVRAPLVCWALLLSSAAAFVVPLRHTTLPPDASSIRHPRSYRTATSPPVMRMHTAVSATPAAFALGTPSWLRGSLVLGTSVIGGTVAGGLHAISGPDHLAALLPRCLGQRWWRAARIGAVWGVGHSISVSAMVVSLYALKGRASSSAVGAVGRFLSQWTECAIGASLIFIGEQRIAPSSVVAPHLPHVVATPAPRMSHAHLPSLPHSRLRTGIVSFPGLLGLMESRQAFKEAAESEAPDVCAASNDTKPAGSSTAILLNGMLCGLSWDGAPSFAPALAMASWGSALLFLAAYNLSTIAVMSACVSIIGEGTFRSAEGAQSDVGSTLPVRLSVISSLLAVGVGALWATKGVLSTLRAA